jgi:predicted nucleic acid-binding Zn ribbon protein
VEEVIQKMDDESPICDKCSKMVPRNLVEMKRVFGDTGKPQFKGSGFYETDYKKKGGE